jgi:hypothetical protein
VIDAATVAVVMVMVMAVAAVAAASVHHSNKSITWAGTGRRGDRWWGWFGGISFSPLEEGRGACAVSPAPRWKRRPQSKSPMSSPATEDVWSVVRRVVPHASGDLARAMDDGDVDDDGGVAWERLLEDPPPSSAASSYAAPPAASPAESLDAWFERSYASDPAAWCNDVTARASRSPRVWVRARVWARAWARAWERERGSETSRGRTMGRATHSASQTASPPRCGLPWEAVGANQGLGWCEYGCLWSRLLRGSECFAHGRW